MTEAKKRVKEYNALAISLPDRVWSTHFAHPRMEVKGDRVYMTYYHNVEGEHVAIREPIAVAAILGELQRLKRRASERK